MFSRRTINYAAPPAGSFWAWSADHDAIEWHDGSTLAMWQEVHGVLKFLGDEGGLPPLGAVLLLLAACRDEWLALCIQFHEKVLMILGVTDNNDVAQEIKETLVRGLKVVNDLPKELRSSFAAKCLLVSALFEGGPHSLPRDDSNRILMELAIHGPGGLQGSLPQMDARARFYRDLRALRTGLARHNAGSLESRLRTGLDNLLILPAPIPDAPSDPRLLLDRLLATGGECGAAAAVAKRAIAMMNFPGNFGTPRDLPVGGISDITNRGTVDRLLLGELAWDDLVLAARLVHNEALYYRREIPPMQVAVGHTVLLDRGLRLWGTGRIFALGVALGLRHHPAMNGPGEAFECVAALTDDFTRLDLETPEGVYSALETLVPAPGPAAFLTAWFESAMGEDEDSVPDLSFITAKECLNDASTCKLLGEIADWIHGKAGQFRVLALSRTGGLDVQAWSPTGNRTLFRGQFDLDEILPRPKLAGRENVAPPLRAKPDPLHALLPIYALDRLPFLFPLFPQGSAILTNDDSSVLGVSADGRLMHWPQTGWGGREIVAKVPGRQHWMGRNDRREPIVIAAGGKAGEHVRVFRVEGNCLHEIQIAPSRHAFPRLATVSSGAVLLAYSDSVEAISLDSGNRVAELPVKDWPVNPVLDFDGERIRVADSGKGPALPLGNWPTGDPSWPRLFSPDSVSLPGGHLTMMRGKQSYHFHPSTLNWRLAMASPPSVTFEQSDFSPAEGVRLAVARLGTKLEIWHDPRGMIHLRNPERDEQSTWSILLSSDAASAWNKSWGLCSLEPRLRLPEAGEPLPLALQDLEQCLTGIAQVSP